MKVKVKDLGVVITGNTPSKKNKEFYNSKDIGFIKPDLISDKHITRKIECKDFISNEAKQKARIINSNAILVTCIGIIGKVAFIEKGEYAFNQQINAIIPNENKISPQYLAYNLFSNRKRLSDIANAPVVPIINKTKFEEFNLNITCDINKQKQIVSILDTVSGIIEKRKKQLEDLDELVKARFVEMFGDPVENPKKYPIVCLKDIAQYWNGLTYKPDDVVSNGTIVLRSSNIQNNNLDYNDLVRVNCVIKDKQYVKENDILMCSRNGSARLVGKVALIKNLKERMSFGAFMMIIRSDYFAYLITYFRLEGFRRQISTGATTTINQITGNMLNKVKLPLPDTKTINQYKFFIEEIDQMKEKIQKSLDEMQVLFDKLMQDYF